MRFSRFQFALSNFLSVTVVWGAGLVISALDVRADSTASSDHRLLKPLPESLTSFGAATQDGYLYVFSGHNGDAHGFSREMLNDKFRRIRYDDPNAVWEELAMHEPAQSVALVSDGKLIYRIAGLSFNNSSEEPQSFCSTDHFASYDPQTNAWIPMPSLPEGRSSLDAAIVGRSIYVAGGWNLQGESSANAQWYDSMLRFDLDKPDDGWQTLPGPGYKTRALAVAALGDHLIVMGGMTKMGFTKNVSIYDTVSQTWSEGPELKSDHAMAGFASSAFAVDGKIYNVGASGILYRLAPDLADWEVADHLLFPRNFLRLLPGGTGRLLAVGGTGAVGRTAAVESIAVQPTSRPVAKWVRWSLEAPVKAMNGQAVSLHQGKLYSFGGEMESDGASIDSSPSREVLEFDLSLQQSQTRTQLPQAVNKAVALSRASTSAHGAIFLLGSAGENGDSQGSFYVQKYDPSTDLWAEDIHWAETTAAIPKGLSGHAVVDFDDAFWLLGGSDGKLFNHQIFHWWGDDTLMTALPNIQLPRPRRDFGCASVDSEFFLLGGSNEAGHIVPEIDVFDAKTRTWRSASQPAVARVHPRVASHNGQIFLFGGFSLVGDQQRPVTELEVYDSQSDQWFTLKDLPPHLPANAHMISLQGRLLFYNADPDGYGRIHFCLYLPEQSASPETIRPMSLAGFTSRSTESPEQNAKTLMRKDTDKDGRLSRDEIGGRMSSFFDSADVDGDGYLTYEEVLQAMQKKGSEE